MLVRRLCRCYTQPAVSEIPSGSAAAIILLAVFIFGSSGSVCIFCAQAQSDNSNTGAINSANTRLGVILQPLLSEFPASAGTAAAGFAVTASAAGGAALDLSAGGRLMGKTICLFRKAESRGDVGVRGCFF